MREIFADNYAVPGDIPLFCGKSVGERGRRRYFDRRDADGGRHRGGGRGTTPGSAGSQFTGGAGASGGGGYFGGGGSSYIANLSSVGLVTQGGSGTTPGGTGDSFYLSGIGVGGTTNNGGNGRIVFSYTSGVAATPSPSSVFVALLGAVPLVGVLRKRRK